MFSDLIQFIREVYNSNDFIPLHAPLFQGNEKQYLEKTIDSTYVSSVGEYVDLFEEKVALFTQSNHAIATVNGTAALHMSLILAGVKPGDFVITQAFTFVATCNAIYNMGATPILIDIDKENLGLSADSLEEYLLNKAEISDEGKCIDKKSGRIIRCVVPMHTFGHPADLDSLLKICKEWNLDLIEDSAESLGSLYKGRHTGTFGSFSAISFNGNKIITTGGGGMILCKREADANKAKHLTTTAKIKHPYEFIHDAPAYNYRLPNLNAALGCAQMEMLEKFIQSKRKIAKKYKEFLHSSELDFFSEPKNSRSNYWLNAVICPDHEIRDSLLVETNNSGIMTRPAWKLMHKLPMYSNLPRGDLSNSEFFEDRLVNLPSSVKLDEIG